MKVKVEKQIELNGDSFFVVRANGKLIRAFYFLPDMEKERKEVALAFAKQIEKSNSLEAIVETIYETPE